MSEYSKRGILVEGRYNKIQLLRRVQQLPWPSHVAVGVYRRNQHLKIIPVLTATQQPYAVGQRHSGLNRRTTRVDLLIYSEYPEDG